MRWYFAGSLPWMAVLFVIGALAQGRLAADDGRQPTAAQGAAGGAAPGGWAPVPEKVASFGSATADGWVYLYSGHIGEAHAHSRDNVTNTFRRLSLSQPGSWEELPAGPGLQGLPLVAHGGKLVRIGGLDARNPSGEDADLHSVPDVAAFDVKTRQWSPLTPLPEGRSSHDAVVVGDKVYVVGGWLLEGKEKGETWHTTSLVMDLSARDPKWEILPEQDFQRRALAVAAARGRIYAMGGMDANHQVSSDVDYLDLAAKQWKKGPKLPGNGFGVAALGVGDALYACGLDGNVYRLNEAGDGWDTVGKLKTARFFHRLLAADPDTLLVVAGASMAKGHLDDIEVIDIGKAGLTLGD